MVPLKGMSFPFVIVCAFLASMLPAVNGAAYYVSSSYWCGSYQYGCGKGCYATAANSCYKYDCPAGQSGTYYTPLVNTCYSCPSGRYTPAANHIDSCYYCPGGT